LSSYKGKKELLLREHEREVLIEDPHPLVTEGLELHYFLTPTGFPSAKMFWESVVTWQPIELVFSFVFDKPRLRWEPNANRR